MMFPGRVTGVKPHHRVLEVGPGGSPHPRSDVLLELKFSSQLEEIAQRGTAHVDPGLQEKEILLYEGGRFPFADKEFDYVICSHVIEHVPDVEEFVAELTRVAKAGYVEFPSIYYEYLYNFKVHLNFVAYVNGELLYMQKSHTQLDSFYPINKFFYRTLELGAADLVDAFREYMCYGFEWTKPFPVRRAKTIDELVGRLPTEFRREQPMPLYVRFAGRVVRKIGSWIGKE